MSNKVGKMMKINLPESLIENIPIISSEIFYDIEDGGIFFHESETAITIMATVEGIKQRYLRYGVNKRSQSCIEIEIQQYLRSVGIEVAVKSTALGNAIDIRFEKIESLKIKQGE